MAEYPTLQAPYRSRRVIDRFVGYDHNPKIREGAFYHMENLSGDAYPLLSTRQKRGLVSRLENPQGLLGKAALALVDGQRLFYGETELTGYLSAAGFVLSEDPSMLPKQLASMGAYLLIFPDRLYINTENYTDCGCVDARFSTAPNSPVTYTLCSGDGAAYPQPLVSPSPPESPQNGDLWIDSSAAPHALKQYSSQNALWVELAAVYVRVEAPGIGRQFCPNDGVTLSGAAAGNGTVREQVAALNGSQVLADCGEDYLVVPGLLDVSCVQEQGSLTVERVMPDVDFITEASNRLWGCKYGLVDGRTVNEIYCCALGDFKNWNRFLGLSTDSYAASVGTDGPWTGAVTHLGHPLFFKEHCLHKVYISPTGAHQIVDTACRGVRRGSHQSLAVVGETLLYHSPTGICAYDGSLPQPVDQALGGVEYAGAVAGGLGDKYYVSLRDGAGDWHLLVYNTRTGFWHREDGTHALGFARCGGELYYLDGERNTLMSVTGSRGSPEEDLPWCAVTGVLGYGDVEQKYVSRFLLRMETQPGAEVALFLQYDSDGVWRPAGQVTGGRLGSFLLPVRPRRCDHFQVKLQGAGEMRLFSLAKVYEKGSDERWQ